MIAINEKTIDTIIDNRPRPQFIRIYVGENIGRYSLNCNGTKFIKLGVEGINYKSPKLYEPPKILVRKTGLGIKASIDRQGTYISQTVYSCNFDKTRSNILLEYYLGLLNSRLIYYYYLKTYGENEWKSHPYITKDILFSLPLRKIDPDNKRLCEKIANLSKSLLSDYSLKIDFELEDLIFQLYDISLEERDLIIDELNKLPDLSAINDMKFPRRDNV